MQLSPLTPLAGTPLPTLQTSTPVQSTPNPMQPTAATPIAAPVYVPAVQQNFQQAHQTFDALAGRLAQGQTGIGFAAAPTQATGAASQVSGRYSVGGGYVTDTPAESAPVPSEQFGPPAPNFTPYNPDGLPTTQQIGSVGGFQPQQFGPPAPNGYDPSVINNPGIIPGYTGPTERSPLGYNPADFQPVSMPPYVGPLSDPFGHDSDTGPLYGEGE